MIARTEDWFFYMLIYDSQVQFFHVWFNAAHKLQIPNIVDAQ